MAAPDTCTAYRLTRDDETRMVERMTEAHAEGCQDLPTLQRLGAHAIGCSTHDLRDVELLWIAARARELLGPEDEHPEWRCDECGRTVEETDVNPHGHSGMCVECDPEHDASHHLDAVPT